MERSWASLFFAAILLVVAVIYTQTPKGQQDEQLSQGHKDFSGRSSTIRNGNINNIGSNEQSLIASEMTSVDDDETDTEIFDDELEDELNDDNGDLHPSCYRGNPTNAKGRPLLLLKYSRTGSTWLAWTGNELKLKSGKPMVWTWEVHGCGHTGANVFDADDLVDYFIEYFTNDQNGRLIDVKNQAPDYMKSNCLQTVKAKDKDFGPLIATINPHETHDETPQLSDEQWEKIFRSVPNLAVGVLVRTNSVKRAISFLASMKQYEVCGRKKITGDDKEGCMKKLPTQLHLNVTHLWKSIKDSEKKRVVVPQVAASLSEKYGDGKIFCLSYEAMERDLAEEMEAFGKYIGADITKSSLNKLKQDSASTKRGSDDLSTYIANYDEVHQSLSSNNCVLDQLVSKKPKVFPNCHIASYDEDEKFTDM